MVVDGTQRFTEKAIKEIKDSNRKNLVRKGIDWLHLLLPKTVRYQAHNWCHGRRQAGSLAFRHGMRYYLTEKNVEFYRI